MSKQARRASCWRNSCAALDGRDKRLLHWITDSGLAVLIADNYAVEAYPARAAAAEDEHAMPRCRCTSIACSSSASISASSGISPSSRGVCAKARRSRFLLTAPPLRLPGAVGSPATPVATV